MKKPHISVLLLVTCIFAAFTMGFFVGRNQNHSTVEVHLAEAKTAETTPSAGAGDAPTDTEATADTSGLININSATHAQLMELPGIGEVLAQRIIDYREENGDFCKVEELLNVSGIGEKKLEAILNLVTTGG